MRFDFKILIALSALFLALSAASLYLQAKNQVHLKLIEPVIIQGK